LAVIVNAARATIRIDFHNLPPRFSAFRRSRHMRQAVPVACR
jgi:hypothetical protein